MMVQRRLVGGMVVLAAAALPVWGATITPTTTPSGSNVDALALRTLIISRVGALSKLQVPAKNEDLPQPHFSDGSIDPHYRITEAKRRLGKLLFFDPVRTSNIRPEFGGVMSTAQTASCGSCHLGAAAAKAGTQINFAVGGEGFGFTRPDGTFVPRRRMQPGLIDLIPTDQQVFDAAGNIMLNGRFDPVDSVPRLVPTLVGFAFNNRLLLGGKAGEPYDPGNPNKANANPDHLPAGENLPQLAFKAHRMSETQAQTLQAIPAFVKLFERAYPDEASLAAATGDLNYLINDDTLRRSIGAFARTVISRNTPWDRFLAGDNNAMTPHQLQGALLFFIPATSGGAGCVSCHSGPALNKMLGDEDGTGVESNFHSLGIGDHPLMALSRQAFGNPNKHDLGRGEVTANAADNFKFKTPTLRQVKDGRQYTHSGQFNAVREVVEYINAGIPDDPIVAASGNVDPLFTNPRGADQPPGLGLNPDQIDALVDFVENGLYDPGLVTLDPTSPTDTFEPSARDMTYDAELHALGAVDGELLSHKCMSSNDALSRRDRGLEFLEVTPQLLVETGAPQTDPSTGNVVQPLTLTNRGTPIDGDLLLVVTGLPDGMVMANAEGRATRTVGMVGMPYMRMRFTEGQLAPGASLSMEMHLQGGGTIPGDYGIRALSGAGVP